VEGGVAQGVRIEPEDDGVTVFGFGAGLMRRGQQGLADARLEGAAASGNRARAARVLFHHAA